MFKILASQLFVILQVENLVVRAWDVSPDVRPCFSQIVTDLEVALKAPAVLALVSGLQESEGGASIVVKLPTHEEEAAAAVQPALLDRFTAMPAVGDGRKAGGTKGPWDRGPTLPCVPLFHSLPHAGLSNEELKKKTNSMGYVMPENTYQYRLVEG